MYIIALFVVAVVVFTTDFFPKKIENTLDMEKTYTNTNEHPSQGK
jgi:hypothetical protein